MLPSHGRSQRFKSSIAHHFVINDLHDLFSRQNRDCAQNCAHFLRRELADDPVKVPFAEVRVDLGRPDRPVSEQFLDRPDVARFHDQVARRPPDRGADEGIFRPGTGLEDGLHLRPSVGKGRGQRHSERLRDKIRRREGGEHAEAPELSEMRGEQSGDQQVLFQMRLASGRSNQERSPQERPGKEGGG